MNPKEQKESLINKLGFDYAIALVSDTVKIWANRLEKDNSVLNKNSFKYWSNVLQELKTKNEPT